MPKAASKKSDVRDLIDRMLQGQRLPLARLISRVQNRAEGMGEIISEIYPLTGRAQVIGITGPPGAGKSSIVDRMIAHYRKQGEKVAVVAVDPSSPFSGGAILGDRIRMLDHYRDQGVFIRSLGTRGKHGGLAYSTQEVVMVLDAAGFDKVLVETAGVGQTELEILKLAQTIVVVLVPESGDSIQVMKAGLMEIADIFAVNKSDRPEADKLVRELIQMVGLVPSEQEWSVPVLKTEAIRDLGILELIQAIDQHQGYLTRSGMRKEKALKFIQTGILEILTEKLSNKTLSQLKTALGQKILNQAVSRKIDPYLAASKISKIKQ